MEEIVVGSYSGHTYNKSGWIYVVLSGVKDFDKYFTIMPLSNAIHKYKRRTLVEIENIRLDALSDRIKQLLIPFTE